MNIAIAVKDGKVAQHFGHCDAFKVFDIERGNIVGTKILQNPGHKPGFLPNFLGDKGIDCIISGGMGASALEIFRQRGIDVITGACGDVDDVANGYIKGALKPGENVCHENKGDKSGQA
ncbi:MAG: NifB/NifX family molybdenum-iron cluster-binding protein [Clostridia bacterium]|nr:NifB/NifX family molybdenum-iron cluster-binding protein [Clostridia bacterium]